MKSLLSTILGGVAQKIKAIFGSKQFKKAQEVAKIIGDLVQEALPVVELIARLTPTQTDDEIVAVAKRFLVPVEVDLSQPLTKRDRENLLFDAAAMALRGNLALAFESAGAAGLSFGGMRFKAISDVPDSVIDSAVQNAYTFLHATVAEAQ